MLRVPARLASLSGRFLHVREQQIPKENNDLPKHSGSRVPKLRSQQNFLIIPSCT